MLSEETDKVHQRERSIDDIIAERERMRRDLDTQLSNKNVDFDNLKRAFDETQYDNENLRRLLNNKQEEINRLEN